LASVARLDQPATASTPSTLARGVHPASQEMGPAVATTPDSAGSRPAASVVTSAMRASRVSPAWKGKSRTSVRSPTSVGRTNVASMVAAVGTSVKARRSVARAPGRPPPTTGSGPDPFSGSV
jgi:hypothetical protein